MKINKILEIILLFFIICIALLPRSIEVLNKNYIFGFDQGRDYLAVKNIVVDHKPTLIGSEVGAGGAGLNGIFQGPLYYYFLSIPFLLTKGDPYGGVVLMFVLSVLSVVFSYLFGKKVLGTIGGLIAGLLFALSPMFIAQARFTWNSNPSTLFILLAFCFAYLGIKKKNKYIFLSSFFAGFVYNFQFAVSIPLSVSIFLFYIFIVKLRDIKKYLILFSGFIIAFLPGLLFELRHGFMGIGGFAKYLFGSKEAGASFLPSQRIVVDHISSFFNAFMDVFPKNIMPQQILFLIVLIPAAYYLYKEKNLELRKFVTFLFLLFPVYFLVFLFFRNTICVYYLIALNAAYILLFSYSVASSFKKNNYLLNLFYILFLLFVVLKTLPALINVFIYDYRDYGGTAKIRGKTDAIDFIYSDAKGEKFSLFIFSPPIYVYPYDYILWWHAKEKFGYVPDNIKAGTFYLLIEKDNDELWYKGWLETVIKDGTVIWEKTLSSGFIVQKRIGK